MTDDELLRRPVVILGSPRAGTSALGRMLQVHSTLHSLIEPRLTWRYGNDRKSDMLKPRDARPEVIARIRKAFANEVRKASATRLLEKTPSNALRVEFVCKALPDCKIIHIMRNGVDSTLSIRSYWRNAAQGIRGKRKGALRQRLREASLSQMPFYALEALRRAAPTPLSRAIGRNEWGPRLPGMRAMLRDLDLLEVCALQWRTCVEQARAAGRRLPADRYCEIKLEELDGETFKALLDFAELDYEQAVMDNFQETFEPGLSRGRRPDADADELEMICRWVAPTMQWLGYDLGDCQAGD